jgi:hypothetical protein
MEEKNDKKCVLIVDDSAIIRFMVKGGRKSRNDAPNSVEIEEAATAIV